MKLVTVDVDPAADEGNQRPVRCQPARESEPAASPGAPWPDAAGEEPEHEEAGYGYGV